MDNLDRAASSTAYIEIVVIRLKKGVSTSTLQENSPAGNVRF